MEEDSRYITGIDVGTENIRIVQGRLEKTGKVKIIGYIETESAGLRRGVVCEVDSPMERVDAALAKLETQSGVEVKAATISINGESLRYTRGNGVINLSTDGGVIGDEDIDRIVRSAMEEHPLPNRHILSEEPYNYRLDGQDGIRNPLGMSGFSLQSQIGFVSVLKSDYESLCASQSQIDFISVVPAIAASAEAVLSRKQRENGVCVVDLGAETTGMAIYEDGVMRDLAVIPLGGHNITKDLAMVLAVVPEVAEELKLKHATGIFDKASEDAINIKIGKENQSFKRGEVDEIIEARLEEIFQCVRKQLQAAGYDQRLPEGIILTGGGANMKHIERYVRSRMDVAVRIGRPGIDLDLKEGQEKILTPQFATAVGLMFCDITRGNEASSNSKKSAHKKSGGGFFSKFMNSLKV